MRMCAIAESKDDAYETATGRDGRVGDGNGNPGSGGGRQCRGPKENVSCVPVKVDHNRVHQHCTETYTDEFGNVYEAEYWIDEYGNPYLRD